MSWQDNLKNILNHKSNKKPDFEGFLKRWISVACHRTAYDLFVENITSLENRVNGLVSSSFHHYMSFGISDTCLILHAFDWHESPEGEEYWDTMHATWLKELGVSW